MTLLKRLTAAAGGMALLVALFALVSWGVRSRRLDAYYGARADARPVHVVDHGPLPPELRESSGLAVSRSHPGIYWTHNDSGDEPRLYALDDSARLVATVPIRGAMAEDWEALDIGLCPTGAEGGPWCLYVSDTGDNGRRRPWVTLYVLPEPDPVSAEPVAVVRQVRFQYREGPFDVEALAVTPGGDVVVATKGRAPSMWLFEIPAEAVASSGPEPLVLDAIARLPIEPDFMVGRWLTGASISADGTVLALRTYTEVYFYEWPLEGEPVTAAPTCLLGPLEPVGEAIAWGPDGRLFLTSESLPRRVGHLLEIECEGVKD